MFKSETSRSSDDENPPDQQQSDATVCIADPIVCIDELQALPGTSDQSLCTVMQFSPNSLRTKSTQTNMKPNTRSTKTQAIADSTSTVFQVKPVIRSVTTQTCFETCTVTQNERVESSSESIPTSETQPNKEFMNSELYQQNLVNTEDTQSTASENSEESNDDFSTNEASSTESKDSCKELEERTTTLQKGKLPQDQIKFTVFEEAVLHVFGKCGQCGSKCVVTMENKIGYFCKICSSCTVESNHYFEWATGPMMTRMPSFHLLLASGILAIGMETSKVVRLFNALKIPNVQRRELSNIIKNYVIPAIYDVWRKEQSPKLKDVENKKNVIASDMRVDSPGHSGLFGSGSTLDMERNIILDTQIIKVKCTQ